MLRGRFGRLQNDAETFFICFVYLWSVTDTLRGCSEEERRAGEADRQNIILETIS